jgi:hypothetical protein
LGLFIWCLHLSVYNGVTMQTYLVNYELPGKRKYDAPRYRTSQVQAEDEGGAEQHIRRQFPAAYAVHVVLKADGGTEAAPTTPPQVKPDVKAMKQATKKLASVDVRPRNLGDVKLAGTPRARKDERLSSINAPQTPVKRPRPVPTPGLGGTSANDAAIAAMPTIGDSVRVDVDKVPRDKRTDVHQFLIDHGVHGQVGVIQGTEVRGGLYMVLVETGSQRVWVPMECVYRDALPEQQDMMQPVDSRISPERMRKHSRGSYNMT